METLDYAIIGGYLLGLIAIGAYLARRAGQGGDDYFLAGRNTPWWALGASGMSSNLDVAGTVTIIALVYSYGLQGFFIEMRGGVVLPIAVWLAFMGKWHRRSQVTTTAEWMQLRFGRGLPGRLARYTAAFTYLVITVAMVVFFLSAAAKFTAQFMPGVSPVTAAVILAIIALAYTMASGLYGVIWTDVFQAFLIGAAAIFISVKAFNVVPEIGPEDWPGAAMNTAWPQLTLPGSDYGSLFWMALLFFAAKGILEGLGGSGGSAYMAQRYYAARNDRDTIKLSMLWAALFTFRWPMVIGFAILAIHHGVGQENPETILGALLLDDAVFPTGLRGLAIAALLAASMSTFDSTINAGASYVVKDLYLPLFAHKRPAETPEAELVEGPDKTLDYAGPNVDDADSGLHGEAASAKMEVYVGYVASAVIVALGLALTLTLGLDSDIVGIWTTIVVAFFPGFLVPFALRWFWARFNGIGFVAGVAAGFVAALLTSTGTIGLSEPMQILFLFVVSGTFSIGGALLTAPVPSGRLRSFYDQIKPWGLWPSEWRTGRDRVEALRDGIRLATGLLWQITMFLLPMLVVLRSWGQFAVVLAIWLALSAYLFFDLRRSRDLAATT